MRRNINSEGSALIITLLITTVLTLIVVAFLQSMSTERITAKSYASILKAQLAAEAGADQAISTIAREMATRPWHGIGYTKVTADGKDQQMLTLYGAASPNIAPTAADRIILSSGSPTTSTTFTAANSVNVNALAASSNPNGWIGSKISGGALVDTPARALWVELLRDSSLPNQPNPRLPNYNPVESRYAYWVEDETSKVDVYAAGNSDGPQGGFLRETDPTFDGAGYVQAYRSGKALDLGALPMVNKVPLDYTGMPGQDINKALINFRTLFPGRILDTRLLARMLGTGPADPGAVADEVKYSTTFFSLSNELDMSGRRRANLNNIVTNSTDPDVIAGDIDDIIYVITGKHTMKTAHPGVTGGIFLNEPDRTPAGPLPDFGQRFFSGNATGYSDDEKKQLYLKRLAANIRDYIDTDIQPTLINAIGVVPAQARPITSPGIAAPKFQAIGKEIVPYFQEHAWRGFIESWVLAGTTATATLRFDHFFELFNPSNKDYTAPAGTFLKVYSQPTWEAGSFPSVVPEDFELDLSGVNVPAGQVVVITTSMSASEDPQDFLQTPGQVVRITPTPASALRFSGVQGNLSFTDGGTTQRGFRIRGRPGSTANGNDLETQFLFGNNQGIIDYLPTVALFHPSSKFSFTGNGSNIQSKTRYLYSTSLRGNDTPSRSGDPRTLSEQLEWFPYISGGNGDQSRFFTNLVGHASTGVPNIPDDSSFGKGSMTYVNPVNWPDYHVALGDSAATAYSLVRDGPMRSIGELGNIYDPHRKITNETTPDIRQARGGGRTLKMGQVDDLVPVNRFDPPTATSTVSWFNGAWRLADIFSADDPALPFSRTEASGKININSVARDGGVALKAALKEFIFLASPHGDSLRAGKVISPAEMDLLIASINKYLTDNGPFLERGELSQIPFFSGATATDQLGGQAGSTTIDRGREELFRRIIGNITTRSLSYSIFSVGESVRQMPDGSLKTMGRNSRRFVVQYTPMSGGAPLTGAASPTAVVDSFKPSLVYDISN